MAEKRKRPYCEAELKNARALGSHVRFKHPGELGVAKPPQKPPQETEVPDAARDKCEVLKYREITKLSVSHPRFYPFFVALPKLGILHFVATSGFARDSRGLP